MQTIEELHAHYMAVRARLNGGKPKLVVVRPVEPEPLPEPLPLIVMVPEAPAITQTPSQAILSEVSQKHEMTIQEMKGKSRKLQFVKARQEAAYRLNSELRYSLTQIGILLGKRDHTTILHAINRYKKNLAEGTGPWARQVAFTADETQGRNSPAP